MFIQAIRRILITRRGLRRYSRKSAQKTTSAFNAALLGRLKLYPAGFEIINGSDNPDRSFPFHLPQNRT